MRKIKLLGLTFVLFCFFGKETLAQSAQREAGMTEVFVFIVQDSLELSPRLRSGASIQQADIRSQQLKTTLEEVNVRSVARTFPDWDETIRFSYSRTGKRVRRPDFHRVFSLFFDSGQEAEQAIKKLNEVPCLDKALPCSYYQNRFYLKKIVAK